MHAVMCTRDLEEGTMLRRRSSLTDREGSKAAYTKEGKSALVGKHWWEGTRTTYHYLTPRMPILALLAGLHHMAKRSGGGNQDVASNHAGFQVAGAIHFIVHLPKLDHDVAEEDAEPWVISIQHSRGLTCPSSQRRHHLLRGRSERLR